MPKIYIGAAQNLLAGVLPALFVMLLTPEIIKQLGYDFFGIFTIHIYIFSLISIMDFGVSRTMALIKFSPDRTQIVSDSKLLAYSFQICTIISIIIILIAALAVLIALQANYLSSEVSSTAFVFALAGAISIICLPFRTIIELRGQFGQISIVKGIFTAFIPISALLPSFNTLSQLQSSAIYILVSRFLMLLAYYLLSSPSVNVKNRLTVLDWKALIKFFNKSKFVGATNVISLVLSYQDRFLLALMLGPSLVAKYAVAYEFSSKVWLANGALTTANTPTVGKEFQRMVETCDFGQNENLKNWKYSTIAFVIIPTLLVMAFSEHILKFWLRTAYHVDVLNVTQILCCGMILNCASQVNFSLLQLAGFERRAFELQIANSVIAIGLTFVMTHRFGLLGAAAAFSFRLIVDSMVCRVMLSRHVDNSCGFRSKELLIIFLLSIFVCYLSIYL